MNRASLELAIVATTLAGAVLAGVVSYRVQGPYGDRLGGDPRVRRIYDPTGRLTLVVFDANGNLKFDTWSYMDGERLLRVDVDEDEDGVKERREHYGPDERLERIEYYAAPDGRLQRTEYYEDGRWVRTTRVDE